MNIYYIMLYTMLYTVLCIVYYAVYYIQCCIHIGAYRWALRRTGGSHVGSLLSRLVDDVDWLLVHTSSRSGSSSLSSKRLIHWLKLIGVLPLLLPAWGMISSSPNTVISTLNTTVSSTQYPASGLYNSVLLINLSLPQPSICTPLASNTRTPDEAKISSVPPVYTYTWVYYVYTIHYAYYCTCMLYTILYIIKTIIHYTYFTVLYYSKPTNTSGVTHHFLPGIWLNMHSL